ncbi:MAG: hypothetical protein EP349_02245 [Alphaproteobacteria bacterium]|nr:MAG: hypothetical protein EP349_02245 [Alphaproteobacteria bacterium]
MPLPLLAAIPAVIAKTAAVVAKTVATTAKATVTAVKAAGTSLKAAGSTAIKATKPMISKLSSGARTVGTKLKSASVQVKQRVSTSVQNRVSKFGDTQKPSIRQIKQALQDREPQKAEVNTQPKGELQVQHGEEKKMEIIPAHIYAHVSNGNYQKPAPSTEPKPDVAPEAQPNAKPKAKAPTRKLG